MSPRSQNFPGHEGIDTGTARATDGDTDANRVAGIGTSTDIDTDIIIQKYVQIKMTNRISMEYILLG